MDQTHHILQTENLSKYFGGLAAVSDCSLKITRGSITGIIGPNGSGKTTLFNLIAGNLKYLVKESQTPKGLNEQGVKELSKAGFYKSLEKTLNSLHRRLGK